MSERFGIPDHSPQHAPDHALQNPTPSDAFGGMGSYETPAAPESGGWSGGGGGGGGVGYGQYVRPKRSVIVAAILAAILGPFGLFYVNVLNGIAGILILPTVMRFLTFSIAPGFGANDMSSISNLSVAVGWSIAIPWAIIGVKIRNARIDRKGRAAITAAES